jgi:hypothetical protein
MLLDSAEQTADPHLWIEPLQCVAQDSDERSLELRTAVGSHVLFVAAARCGQHGQGGHACRVEPGMIAGLNDGGRRAVAVIGLRARLGQ